MLDSNSPVLLAETIVAALRYLRHFPEALDNGATLCFPTGESLFISAETVRAASQEAAP
jgi:hypothetical protein